MTERELDLLHALQHVLKADLGEHPEFNRQWASYHLQRATQGMSGADQPEFVHTLLERWAASAPVPRT